MKIPASQRTTTLESMQGNGRPTPFMPWTYRFCSSLWNALWWKWGGMDSSTAVHAVCLRPSLHHGEIAFHWRPLSGERNPWCQCL